ncbi:hypothetical protein [Brevundimonas sp.]|uniref:hypothetical protein n=1 Tax=Brevundimonas sp. TaxID=1871086 RepID=UPI002D6AA138|nr:hypothetical protein [Brevundimonas sp.]HYD28003.1 hypothetical protein [Brevundimonas sp.]
MILIDLLAGLGFWVAIAALIYSMMNMGLLFLIWLRLQRQKSLSYRTIYQLAELEPYKVRARRSFVVFGAGLFVFAVVRPLSGLLSVWSSVLFR